VHPKTASQLFSYSHFDDGQGFFQLWQLPIVCVLVQEKNQTRLGILLYPANLK
jgi:hypothetical protein